jgi:heme/copper-type cytochrome/quinol oxidase subunit 2
MKTLIKRISVFLLFFTLPGAMYGQLPTHYPTGDEPVEITLVNILIFFVTPVLLLIFYLYWRKSRKKKRQKEMEELKKSKNENVNG